MYLMLLMCVSVFVSCNNDDDEDEDEYGNWTEGSVLEGDVRGNAADFVIGDKGYIVAGYNGESDDYYADAWVFDSANNSWDDVDDFPGEARSGAVGFAINGKGYVGSGLNSTGDYLNDFYQFDPSAASGSQWTQIASLVEPGAEYVMDSETGTLVLVDEDDNKARARAIGFSLGNFGYVGTGNDGSDQKDFYKYDPTTNTWSEVNGYPGDKRRNGAVFIINDVAYIGTGENNGSFLEDFYSFDGTTWTELSDLDEDEDDGDDVNVLLTNSVGFSIDGKGYFATGDLGAVTSSVFEYDPSDDTWTQLADFEGSSREGASSFTFSDSAYVLLGYSSSLYFDDMFTLNPEELQDTDD